MRLSIILPTLNEEKAIGQTIDTIPTKTLNNMGHTTDILVIDSRSTDNTVEIAREKGADVILCPKGYGRAYKTGFQHAQGHVIITADSDNSYPLETIPQLLSILHNENIDFITVNRFAHIKKGSMSVLNRLGNMILTSVTNLLFGLNLKDSQSGMWIFRRHVLKELNMVSNGMSFSQEIKIEAFKKLQAKEVDGSYKKRLGEKKLRLLSDGLSNLYYLCKKRLVIE